MGARLPKSLLPPNASALDRAAEAAGVRAVDAIPVPHRDLWSPDRCPIDLLPWLAWSLGVESWRSYWPEALKRSRVRSAIPISRSKGSVASVRRVVESFGGQIALREWWQTTPKGAPHTFELVLTLNDASGAETSAAFVDDVIAEVERTKPLRSHFTFVQGLAARVDAALVAVARPAVYARLDLQVL